MSNLSIKAITEKGNEKIFNGWSKCEEAGFSAAPENSYEFKQSDVGKKTITITHKVGELVLDDRGAARLVHDVLGERRGVG